MILTFYKNIRYVRRKYAYITEVRQTDAYKRKGTGVVDYLLIYEGGSGLKYVFNIFGKY